MQSVLKMAYRSSSDSDPACEGCSDLASLVLVIALCCLHFIRLTEVFKAFRNSQKERLHLPLAYLYSLLPRACGMKTACSMVIAGMQDLKNSSLV